MTLDIRKAGDYSQPLPVAVRVCHAGQKVFLRLGKTYTMEEWLALCGYEKSGRRIQLPERNDMKNLMDRVELIANQLIAENNFCIANGLMKGDTKEMFKDTGYNKAQSRKHEFLDVATMRRLYDFWKADEEKDKDGNELFPGRGKYAIFRDLGLFLFMYLGDGQNLADTLRLTYDELYYATHGKQLRFLRHKTRERNESASEVIFPVTPRFKRFLTDTAMSPNSEGEYSQ